MAISLFKKATPTLTPHEEALAASYRAHADLCEKSLTNQRAIESTTSRRSGAAAAEQRLQAVSDAWIAARADVEMGAGSEEYVATLERQRIALETEIRPIREDARVAERVEAKRRDVQRRRIAAQLDRAPARRLVNTIRLHLAYRLCKWR